MKRKQQIACVLFLAGVFASCISVVAFSQQESQPPAKAADDLPPGPGKDAFVSACSSCHGTDIVTAERKTADGWKDTVVDMRNRGADFSDQDQEKIIQYLAKNFGPK
jgi:cytochrome c5